MLKALFVAVDGGAREALRPVAEHAGAALANAPSVGANDASWRQEIDAVRPALLVVGTSDSETARAIEASARRAAQSARVPIAAIEDFPGNYREVPGGEASLLLVESELARAFALERLGERAPRVEVAVPARYDPYRAGVAEARRRIHDAWTKQPRPGVLWAGQPETEDGVRTLEALLPALRAHAVELLFKAHPRDLGYAEGAYGRLLDAAGVAVVDLTAAPLERALERAPRLIVTQFSSLAIEGGFFGVPSLWLLLAEAGGARLLEKKGYAIPPVCVAGAAACATHETALAATLARALEDTAFRDGLMRCFDSYYGVHEQPAAHATARLLAAVAAK